MATVYPVKVTLGDRTWDFTGDDAKGLAACSEFVRGMAEDAEANGNDASEAIPITIEGGFDAAHLEDAFTYLRDSNWQPMPPARVAGGTVAELGLDVPSKALLDRYTHDTIFEVFMVADYFRMDALRKLCLMRVAVEVFLDASKPDALKTVMARCGCDQSYSMQIEANLKVEYPFLSK